jgi:hypothetical protein
MDNVVALRGSERTKVEMKPEHSIVLIDILRQLFVTRAIDRDAYFVGIQVAQAIQATNQFVVVLSHRDVQRNIVVYGSRVIGGRACESLSDFIGAMQELQSEMFIGSHYQASRLEESDWLESHFTRDPRLTAGIEYTSDTPIHFKFDPSKIEELVQYGKDCEHRIYDFATTKVISNP